MRIPYEQPDESFPINVTNMIDVFLLLLIFFLVATTFAKQERDAAVQLPVAGDVQAITAPPREMVINIRESGAIIVGGKEVSRPELQGILQKTHAEDPGKRVLIRTDGESKMKYYAAVAILCRNAGFDESSIGYIPESDDK